MLEATALPIEPQPLPFSSDKLKTLKSAEAMEPCSQVKGDLRRRRRELRRLVDESVAEESVAVDLLRDDVIELKQGG